MLGRFKRISYVHVLPDVFAIVASLILSFFIRLDAKELALAFQFLPTLIAISVVVKIATFAVSGVYDIMWRYFSAKDSVKILRAVLLSSLLFLTVTYLMKVQGVPRSTFFIDVLLLLAFMVGFRLARRFLYERASGNLIREDSRRTLIYGAGNNGRMLAQRLTTDAQMGHKLIGFIDDDGMKRGRLISGHKVLGTIQDLSDIIRDNQVQELIVAITTPPPSVLKEVVQICRSHKIRPRLINSVKDEKDRKTPFDILRGIELSDLLKRNSPSIDLSQVRDLIRHKRVLITGAGGSIGSELARQISRYTPARMLLLDNSEYNLYEIDRELRIPTNSEEPETIVPLLIDVQDKEALENVFREFMPEIVFHAAAYKHVHLVEMNPFAAIGNNIAGTRNLVQLTEKYGISHFVLISTDKAVNPIGVMGATKRLCELIVAKAARNTNRQYCSVRFGNVLGSSGSLLPLLQKQIINGEPITITHPDMSRYFMSIPEAVSLVLKATTISKPGDIAVLNMGEPVKIVDIAKNLITLMGKDEKEVPIIFTGIRPGEKMFEELYLCGNEISTEHPDILLLPKGDGIENAALSKLDQQIDNVLELANKNSKEAVISLNALVKGAGVSLDESAQSKGAKSGLSLVTR